MFGGASSARSADDVLWRADGRSINRGEPVQFDAASHDKKGGLSNSGAGRRVVTGRGHSSTNGTLESLDLGGGRVLEYAVRGEEDGPVVLFHHGMPGSAVPVGSFFHSATERGYRIVTYSRPGYGASTSMPGRTLADTAEVSHVLMDHLGVDRYVVAGWSSGGPHAMATGAADPQRVSGVLLLGSFAPYDADGLNFVGDMGLMNIIQFRALARGDEAQRTVISQMAAAIREGNPAEVASAMASLLPTADAMLLNGTYGVESAVNMHHGLADGYAGWFEDLHALTAPWGFDPAGITAPIELWHGAMDRMVPVAHGAWLAAHLPTVRAHIENKDGHISIAVGSLGEKLDQLVARMG